MRRAADTGRLVAWASAIAAFSALNYYSHFAADDEPRGEPLYTWAYAIGGVIQFGVFLGLVLLLVRNRPLRDYLALGRPTSWWRSALIGLGVVALVVVASAAIQPFADPGEEQGLIPEDWNARRAAPFVANFVVVAVLAPLAEEFLFRGVGYTLLEPFGTRWAIVVTAVAWALAHGLVSAFPIIVVFGLGLAYLRTRVGSIVPGLIVHVLFNATILLAAVGAFGETGG